MAIRVLHSRGTEWLVCLMDTMREGQKTFQAFIELQCIHIPQMLDRYRYRQAWREQARKIKYGHDFGDNGHCKCGMYIQDYHIQERELTELCEFFKPPQPSDSPSSIS